MVNHFPMRLHRGFSSAKAVDLLEISEKLEVPVEKESEASNVNQNDSELIKLLESQNEKTSNDSDKNLTLEKSIIEKISK